MNRFDYLIERIKKRTYPLNMNKGYQEKTLKKITILK